MKDIKGNTVEFDFSSPEINGQETVYVGKFDLTIPEVMEKIGTKTPRELYLFGGSERVDKYECLAFCIVEKQMLDYEVREHYLSQGETTAYCKKNENTRTICADLLKRSSCPFIRAYPAWHASQMSWPCTENEQLYFFTGQFYVPKNELNSKLFSSNMKLYFFVHVEQNDKIHFAVTVQPGVGEQSIQDHYKFEEAMIEYENNKDNLEIVEKLVKRKLKDFQLYLLDQSDLRAEVLELIAEHGKTKAIKNEALSRLKEAK